MRVIPEKIEVLDFILHELNFQTSDNLDIDLKNQKFKLDINLDHNLNFEEKLFRLKYTVLIISEDEEGKESGLKVKFIGSFIVRVNNLSDFISEKEGKKQVESIIGSTVIGITYSTLRGIIYCKLAGTPLEQIMLPVINPKSLLEEASKPNP